MGPTRPRPRGTLVAHGVGPDSRPRSRPVGIDLDAHPRWTSNRPRGVCCYFAAMRSITVRNVPDRVHRELSARAARRGQSLQEYLLAELTRLSSRPAPEDLIERVRARKNATGTRLERERILAHRDADRR